MRGMIPGRGAGRSRKTLLCGFSGYRWCRFWVIFLNFFGGLVSDGDMCAAPMLVLKKCTFIYGIVHNKTLTHWSRMFCEKYPRERERERNLVLRR
jgi:hypothetical protein